MHKKIILSSILSIFLFSSTSYAKETTTISSEFEKKVNEEAISFIEKENRLIDLYSSYIMSTGDVDYINFLKYNNIDPKGLEENYLNSLTSKKISELSINEINSIFSNTVFKSFNSPNNMSIFFNNSNIILNGTIYNDKSFATQTFLSYVKSEGLAYSFNNNISSRMVQLKNEVMDMFIKLKSLKEDGGKIIPYDKINDLNYIKNIGNVSNNELFYVSKLDYTLDVFLLNASSEVQYLGNMTNFHGIILNLSTDLGSNPQNLSNFIPKITGSIAHVLKTDIDGTSSIEEYIYDGNIWKLKFKSLNIDLKVQNSLNKLRSIETVQANISLNNNNNFVQSSYDDQYTYGDKLNHYKSYGSEVNLSKDSLYGSGSYNTDSHFTFPKYFANNQLRGNDMLRNMVAMKSVTPSFYGQSKVITNTGSCCWINGNANPAVCQKYYFTCDFGGVFNKNTGLCEFVNPKICPSGYVLNATNCEKNINLEKDDKIDIVNTATNKFTSGKYDVGFGQERSTYTSTVNASFFYYKVFEKPFRNIYAANKSGSSYSCNSGDLPLWNSSDIVDGQSRISANCQEKKLSCPATYNLDIDNGTSTCSKLINDCASLKTKFDSQIDVFLGEKISYNIFQFDRYSQISNNNIYNTSGGKCSTIDKVVVLDNNYLNAPYVEINYKTHGELYGENQEDNKRFRDFSIYSEDTNELLTYGVNQDLMDSLNNSSYISLKNSFLLNGNSSNIINNKITFDKSLFKDRSKANGNSKIIFKDSILNLNQVSPVSEFKITE